MSFAYSNNGLSWRAVEADWPLATGEILFDAEPTESQLSAAFPKYSQAAQQAALASQAQAALLAGMHLSSAGTPSINGVYACDRLSQSDIIAIETGINSGKGFPGGGATYSYPDVSGIMHTFNEENFTAFAAAVRDYVYCLNSVIAGQSAEMPSSTSTIA